LASPAGHDHRSAGTAKEIEVTHQPHPHRAGHHDWITFLVTGPEANLAAFWGDARWHVELFDRRGQTVRCRAHGDDRGLANYARAAALAKREGLPLPKWAKAPGPRPAS
jgi:hypothetical protein